MRSSTTAAQPPIALAPYVMAATLTHGTLEWQAAIVLGSPVTGYLLQAAVVERSVLQGAIP